MKIDDAVETIAKFFNDLIGAWVPGSVLATGLILMHLGPGHLQSLAKLSEGAGIAVTLAGLLFALGHVLLAVYENAIKPLLQRSRLSSAFNEAAAENRQSYRWFVDLVRAQQGTGAITWSFHDLRSVALSISAEAASIGRRFMFVSLLCSGVGSALLIIGVDYLVCFHLQPELLYSYKQVPPWFVQAILLFGTALLLFKQGGAFYSRAMTTPFSVAVAELKLKREDNASSAP
jgi:hypothetical protein